MACHTPSAAQNKATSQKRTYTARHTHIATYTHVRVDKYIVHTHTVSHTRGLLLVTRIEVIPLCADECPPLPSTKEGALTRESLGRLMYSITLYVVKGPATPAVLDYLLKLAVLLARSVQCLSVAVSSSPHTDIEEVAGFTRTQRRYALCSHFRKKRNFPVELATFV